MYTISIIIYFVVYPMGIYKIFIGAFFSYPIRVCVLFADTVFIFFCLFFDGKNFSVTTNCGDET